MAITCPACGAENRSVAKFCIECVTPLPADFAATQVLTVPARMHGSRAEEPMPSALAAFAAATTVPPVSAPSAPQTAFGAPDLAAASKPAPAIAGTGVGVGIGVGLAIFALLLAGTIGWLAAGGGFWSSSREGRSEPAKMSEASPAPEAVQAGLVPSATSSAGPSAAPVASADAPVAVAAVVPVAVAAPVAAAAPAPVAAPEAVSLASAYTSASAQSASAAVAAKPAAPKSERAQDLFARCQQMGFIQASRCKVDLCQASANRQRRECQPVLAQLRQMEEKRNPTMAD